MTGWLSLPVLLVKLHYFLLVPWIVFSIPTTLSLGEPVLLTVALVFLGTLGMFTGWKSLAMTSSLTTLLFLIMGRIIGGLSRLEPSDTSILLLQFVATIFLMETSMHVLAFEKDRSNLEKNRDDELFTENMIFHLRRWLQRQLYSDMTLGLGTFLLSLGLLVVGGFAGVQVNHLALLAVLVLASVVALLFLLTYQRESEPSGKNRQ